MGDRDSALEALAPVRDMSMIDGPANAKGTSEPLGQELPLQGQVRRGLGWSLTSSLVLRMGSLVLGIVLARLLTPETFGVYAVALTVQSILMTLSDLGLSADLIRSRDPERRAPTVATLSLISGFLLAVLMSSIAVPLASAMGAPSAAPVIVVLSFTLILSGLGVVPYAKLQRNIEQKKLFATGAADFVVSTSATLLLVLIGMGPMALAIGRLAAQGTATALQFVLSRTVPKFALERSLVGSSLRFGLPLAGANLLSWVLLNIDNVVIARVAGGVALGYYVLAFNISSWPMSAIGTAIRSVSFAAFSRMNREREDAGEVGRDAGLATATAFAWAAALPAGALLAVLSVQLIQLLYGEQWGPSAPVLAALGLFGALRVVFDLMVTYLMAHGASRPVFWIQALWIVVLTPVLVVATQRFGVQGAGWAHVVVAAAVILPMYLWALHRVNADLHPLMGVLWPPLLAGTAAWFAADLVAKRFDTPILAVTLGGIAGGLVYIALLYRWLRRFSTRTKRSGQDDSAEVAKPVEGIKNIESLGSPP